MLLLFAGGIMNLYWITGLAVYVLGEKLLPAGHRIARWAGAALLVAGVAMVTGRV
jgi:predicted metal-binding membrane protein